MNSFPKFNFKQFEDKYLISSTLDAEVIDFTKYYNKLNDNDKILIEEHAAIMEFDEGLLRAEAEILAIQDYLKR